MAASRSGASRVDKKAAKAASKAAAAEQEARPLSQLRQVYSITRETDRQLPLWMLGAFAGRCSWWSSSGCWCTPGGRSS